MDSRAIEAVGGDRVAREFAYRFYRSTRWKKCRAAYIQKRIAIDGGLCESCRVMPGYIVHHKTELTPDNIGNPEIALSMDNLKYDCLICHNKENKNEEPEGLVRYEFDENGMPVPNPPHKKEEREA